VVGERMAAFRFRLVGIRHQVTPTLRLP